jgi:hypothetical protein
LSTADPREIYATPHGLCADLLLKLCTRTLTDPAIAGSPLTNSLGDRPVTLYQSRGDQISRYGYAAFDLTVAPYVVMSAVNLLGNLMVPGYPALYLVKSSVMIEARKDGGACFDGVVGRLKESLDGEFINKSTRDYWLTEPPEFEQLMGEKQSRATIKA